ncbi:hypothetical protein [Solibacillus cecembensis]|uniref:hypothetical protein n=1 Tax=Solibacillus cecembensis TaxID=459347 RepID=UPI003D0079D5
MEDILNETILSFNDYIERVPNGCMTIVNILRDDRIAEALTYIRDFSEGASWLMEASELLKKNNVSIQLDMTKIIEYLMEINEGLSIEDYNLVADIFEYEIAPFFLEIDTGAFKN